MVAVQEMKKTTATADTNMSSNTKSGTPKGQANDLDGIEDLSYGPGIVSKLRCRYLSLALRESMEKERHSVDNMRRATSLSNLLERDDHEDDDDDEDEQQAATTTTITTTDTEAANAHALATGVTRASNEVSKMRATFLKQANAQSVKPNAYGRAGLANGNEPTTPTRITQTTTTTSVAISASAEQPITRSRQFKRGNDSIKRARSVEALLCERSPWQFVGNRSSYQPHTMNTTSTTSSSSNGGGAGTAGAVSIEDKIHNARERLLSGTDTTPPKRLTSIIDDTERPPPDLVKQTLRLFEATANRRRGGPQRQNSKGDVATKVANYKSIINEHKPAVVFPKQPPSPTKKLTPTPKPIAKPVIAAADLLNSPIGRKTLSVGNASDLLAPENASTPKQPAMRSNGNAAAAVAAGSSFLSADAPDIIPRHNIVRHLTEKSEQSAANGAPAVMCDSPVTALTKKLEKLCFDTSNCQVATNNNGSAAAAPTMLATNASTSKELSLISLTKLQQQQQQQQSQQSPTIETVRHETIATTITHVSNTTTITSTNTNTSAQLVGVDALAEAKTDRASGAPAIAEAANVSDAVASSTTNAKALDANAVTTMPTTTTTTSSSSSTISEPHQAYNESMQQAASSEYSSSDLSDDEYGNASPTPKTKRITRTALENIARAGTTQQFKFVTSSAPKFNGGPPQNDNTAPATPAGSEISSSSTTLLNASAAGKQIGVIRPLISNASQQPHHQHHLQHQHQQQPQSQPDSIDLKSPLVGNYIPPAGPATAPALAAAAATTGAASTTSSNTQPLTTREIEKNRINELKKTHAYPGISGLHTLSASESNNSLSSNNSGSQTANSSLDTVITTYSSSAGAVGSGLSELDAAAAAQMSVGSTNSPLWALRKKRQSPAPAENTSMVFNFSNRKEVPDYIENDGVIIRRKRELPKPNESGFVLLGDLLVETSTDNDYDEYSMCPPSPCDVEFENANIVIDGKSSIRNKPKEATFRVQFNDTLTSTFEYPSEASLIVEESFNDYYTNPADDLDNAFQKLRINDAQSPRQHHHVAVDEIIQLPTTASAHENNDDASTPTKNVMGNLPLGSAPLGLYTPIKAPIDNLFELGVTRAPATNGHAYATNGNDSELQQNGGSIIGIKDGLNGDFKTSTDDEPESLQYLKPANDDLNMVYSEGTQKTDLLY